MASLNKVLLMGNLTRDPELRYTPNGTAVASFGLAVNQKYKQGDEWKDDVCFIDITTWGRTAENCAEYLAKGKLVFVEGRLKYRTWSTDEGQKRSKLDVTALTVQFLSSGDRQGGGGQGGKPKPEKSGSGASSGEDDQFYSDGPPPDDDLPF